MDMFVCVPACACSCAAGEYLCLSASVNVGALCLILCVYVIMPEWSKGEEKLPQEQCGNG